MALQTVNVFVEDNQVIPQPIEDVTVRVFMMDDVTIVTEGLTDAAGQVSFTLDDVNPSYLLRYYKFGVAIPQPQQINLTGAAPFDFETVGERFTHPVATDPLMCRVSGYLRDQFGNAVDGRSITVRPVRDPAISGLNPSTPIVGEDYVTTVDDGYVVFDVYKDGLYDVLAPGWIDEVLRCEVPADRDWMDIADFLLPTAVLVEFSDTPPLVIPINGTGTANPIVKLSNGMWLHESQVYDRALVEYSSSDDGVMTVDMPSNRTGVTQVVMAGVGLGVAQLQAEIVEPERFFARRVPEAPTSSTPLDVVVVS